MELANKVHEALKELVGFFNCPYTPSAMPSGSTYSVHNWSDQAWYYKLEGRSYYEIHFDNMTGVHHYRLRKGKVERYYRGDYILFVRIYESYGNKSYYFNVYDMKNCDRDRCERDAGA